MVEYVIGIDIGGTNIKAGAVDYRGTILARKYEPTEAALGAEAIFNKLESIAASLQQSVTDGHLKAIGLGVPGAVLSRQGIVTQAPNIPVWDGLPIQKIMQDRLQHPCFIENDANAIAVGEVWMGAGRGSNHVVCLTLGTGVGGGIITEGELLRGADGMASEPGHLSVDVDGPRCNCGSQGCLETYASSTGILRRMLELLPDRTDSSLARLSPDAITTAIIYEHAVKGDSFSLELLQRAGKGLGVGLATLVNIFNPEIIIIGGGVAAAWDLMMPLALNTMRERAFKAPAARVRVVRAQKQDDAGIYGNAYVAWDSMSRGHMKRTRERSLTPWGFWEVLEEGPDYKAKRIYVHPGHRLSYQKHQQREETWMIASGEASITLDGSEQRLSAGETIFIRKTQAHRIANPGPEPLVFFEVQRGTYFGEDDIVRLQDDYKRT
jgi:glucokinase